MNINGTVGGGCFGQNINGENTSEQNQSEEELNPTFETVTIGDPPYVLPTEAALNEYDMMRAGPSGETFWTDEIQLKKITVGDPAYALPTQAAGREWDMIRASANGETEWVDSANLNEITVNGPLTIKQTTPFQDNHLTVFDSRTKTALVSHDVLPGYSEMYERSRGSFLVPLPLVAGDEIARADYARLGVPSAYQRTFVGLGPSLDVEMAFGMLQPGGVVDMMKISPDTVRFGNGVAGEDWSIPMPRGARYESLHLDKAGDSMEWVNGNSTKFVQSTPYLLENSDLQTAISYDQFADKGSLTFGEFAFDRGDLYRVHVVGRIQSREGKTNERITFRVKSEPGFETIGTTGFIDLNEEESELPFELTMDVMMRDIDQPQRRKVYSSNKFQYQEFNGDVTTVLSTNELPGFTDSIPRNVNWVVTAQWENAEPENKLRVQTLTIRKIG